MFLTKKHISRRTALKAAGVSLGLPFLDAMVPAGTALAQTAAVPKLRMGFFYMPHGAIMYNTSHGPAMDKWTPSGSGENFNAVGQWRDVDADGKPVDASGGVPGVAEFRGIDGLENALLARPDLFVTALTEKLMMYAINRKLEYFDMPQVRTIVRGAAKDNYKLSSIVLGIANSDSFRKQGEEATPNVAATR